ncbi:TPA: hypothetical protein ACH3X2_003727 [Trebouxia sp. C0005]
MFTHAFIHLSDFQTRISKAQPVEQPSYCILARTVTFQTRPLRPSCSHKRQQHIRYSMNGIAKELLNDQQDPCECGDRKVTSSCGVQIAMPFKQHANPYCQSGKHDARTGHCQICMTYYCEGCESHTDCRY